MTNIVKNSPEKRIVPVLDDTDRKLISHLQEDGRMSFVKLASLMGVTEGTIRRKYKKLVKDGALKITAISNPYATGFDAPAFIGINVERRLLENVAEKLAQMPEVQFVAVTTGTYEIIIQVISCSNKNLYDLIMKIGGLEGIQNTHTFLMLNIYKHSWKFIS